MGIDRTTAPPQSSLEREDWALEHLDAETRKLVRLQLSSFPVRIGRLGGLDLSLLSPSISGRHAEIRREGSRLVIEDLGSTNGTFVNNRRIDAPVTLTEGDIVHLASLEFRLVRLGAGAGDVHLMDHLPTSFVEAGVSSILRDAESLERLLVERAAHSLFQPIVSLASGATVAYEALGRGLAANLPDSPGSLFEVATSVGREQALSRLLREGALEQARTSGLALPLFLNIHPTELSGAEWMAELRDALSGQPPIDLVIELSEHLAVPAESLRALRADLDALGVRLAYDDFGAGLARINELAEAPAHFLKFDYALIHELDRAGEAKHGLVGALVDAAKELGMVTLAEGIETAGEAAICRALGFELGQGYLLGRPGPLPNPRARLFP